MESWCSSFFSHYCPNLFFLYLTQLSFFKSKQNEMCCDFENFYFFLFLVWFRVSKLVDSSIDMQIIKLPSFHSHPLVSRVPVNRIKCLHSRIFSIQSSLPIQPNTGVSKYFKCMQESRFLFQSWNHDIILSRSIYQPLIGA